MKDIRKKLAAVAAVAIFAVSAAGCESTSPDGGNKPSTAVTEADNSALNNNEDSSIGNSGEDDSSTEDAAVSEAPVPEVDDDGSKVSVVEVTDAAGSAVTDAQNKPVTELVIVDDKGSVVTDAKGSNAKPNIVRTPAPTAAAKPSAGSADNQKTDIGKPPKMEENNASAAKPVDNGPTVSLPSVEAKPGEEITLQINVSDNKDGFTALVAWVDLNSEFFEFVEDECVAGDHGMENYKRSDAKKNTDCTIFQKADEKDVKTVNCMYFDSNFKLITGDLVLATLKIKVKDSTPAGTYDIKFDADGDNGSTMCNRVINPPEILAPAVKYVNGKITVK